ncbi:MAG: ATPase [Candidatus Handelsmanbacteria bacterium RIFCSPLOWO2_12_FULL_64_10]|uniref:ATPase n=1 Tax=Handelsmanbacteria sp. (strain RIFCSPLOWO2_12_FULL_64_10) TaxID=1817868 RepID=A0A1F6C3M1_HANXR|nr:MAG: ATPase [Candidatus Handelsmanbacteria bacterium RIFCSPLOWO2_12_FULL_64_10]
MKTRTPLGVITKGSLIEGLEMKLDPSQGVEDVKAGKFVVIEGAKNEFFSMITDLRLDATNPEVLIHPPQEDNPLLHEVLNGTSTYISVCLRPMLMLEKGQSLANDETRPVKTIPPHFSRVSEAEEADVARVFGSESMGDRYFNIGTPLDMETPVCLDLSRFAERSNGIFGKTGTGKSFLTRLVLSGLINNEKAVNLIFDMHNEYGWKAVQESGVGKGAFVKGLKQLFGEKVAIFSLDPKSTRARGVQPDHEVAITYDQVAVEDVIPLQEELRLNPTAAESAYLVYAIYKEKWLRTLLSQDGKDIEEFAKDIGANPISLVALHRKLKRFERYPFFVDRLSGPDAVDTMMDYIDRGIHIVLEFGQETSVLCYLLVANIIARRIHENYIHKSEKYYASQDIKDQPRQLIITIEEAHKFLNPFTAKQTIFGTIAREMRKYFVSLLIVDQRPSGIDEEVLSQIGTKITALLNDEKDIQAVLTGVSNAAGLRSVLASLDTKQQALILGHAVPMPVVIKTRDYDEKFYRDMGCLPPEERKKKTKKDIADLFGEAGEVVEDLVAVGSDRPGNVVPFRKR